MASLQKLTHLNRFIQVLQVLQVFAHNVHYFYKNNAVFCILIPNLNAITNECLKEKDRRTLYTR